MATDVWLAATRSRIELKECVLEMLINLHDSCLVATSVAVIGSAEDGHHVAVLTPVVALQQAQRESNRRQLKISNQTAEKAIR